MFSQLSAINASRTNWRIKARITRMWPSISSASTGNGALKGYNMIFLDDDNFHVHSYVYVDTWNAIADKIEEGALYVISNFYAKEATGSLKPVGSKYLINFSPNTTVERIAEDDFMIPRHKFEFLDLGDLFDIASRYKNVDFPEFSVDLIGVIEDFDRVTEIKTMYGNRHIVKFRLTDGRYSHKVSVWGNHALSLDAQYSEMKNERPIIVILASTKLKTYKSSVQISSLPSSKIYLNLDIDAVSEMKQRLEEEGYTPSARHEDSEHSNSIAYSSDSAEVIETLTLKQLSQKTRSENVEQCFMCKVKITTVEKTDNWWYKSCLDCYEEVTKLEGSFRCPACKKNNPVAVKRFRIFILAEDESEAYNFVLLDRAAKRLVGKTATSLIAESLKAASSESFPCKIKDITGKEVTLKIKLRADNVLLNSSIFYATDAFDYPSPSSNNSDKAHSDFSISSYSDNNVVELAGSGNTPDTAKSSNKKIKMEALSPIKDKDSQ